MRLSDFHLEKKSGQPWRRRTFSILLGFALLSGSVLMTLSGCQRESESQNNQITLEFWTLQLDAFKDTLEPMFREYEQMHPNVQIKWVDVPFSEGPKRTLTAMMSGHTPDVINLNPDFSAILANRNALINMNEALPLAVKNSYLPVAWQAATLVKPSKKDTQVDAPNSVPAAGASTPTAAKDGQVKHKTPAKSQTAIAQTGPQPMTFGLPWYITSSVTIYNKAILQKAGFEKPPATFDALPDFAERVRKATGAYGMMPVIAERGNFLKELQKIGVPLYDAQGRAIFASDLGIAHLSHFVDMYQQGWVPAEAITEGHQAAVGRFQAGTLASLLVGPNFLKIVKENAPEIFKVTGVAPQFPENAGFKDFSLMVLVVPTKSEHPKEAVDFAAFITNAKNQLALAQAAPVLPSVSKALSNPYFMDAPPDDLMAQGRKISATQLLQAKTAYQIQPNQNAINEIVDHYVQLALLGKRSPVEALRRAQDEINATLEMDP